MEALNSPADFSMTLPSAKRTVGALAAVVMTAQMFALVGITALVVAPYGRAIITGCL